MKGEIKEKLLIESNDNLCDDIDEETDSATDSAFISNNEFEPNTPKEPERFACCTKNKVKRNQILCSIFVVSLFAAIFFVSFAFPKPDSPVLLMTSHDGNILGFNALTAEIITTNLLDLNQEPLYSIQSVNSIQFRGMLIHDDHLVVANGNNDYPFIGIFECDHDNNQWHLIDYFANNTIRKLIHPYGISWYFKKEWYIIATQTTNYVFVLDKYHNVLHKSQIVASSNTTRGLRCVTVDNDMDLIFIAARAVCVLDITVGFKNIYNISLPSDNYVEPVTVIVQEHVLYVTDRANDRIYAFDYDRYGYSLKWSSEFNQALKNPTGMALDGDTLYVLSQKNNKIIVYDAKTGLYKTHFSPNGMGVGEQLLFVQGNQKCSIK